MSSTQQDLSIFKKFNFDRPPVGVKFLPNKPDGIKKLDKILDFCEMLPEAQGCRRLGSELNFPPYIRP